MEKTHSPVKTCYAITVFALIYSNNAGERYLSVGEIAINVTLNPVNIIIPAYTRREDIELFNLRVFVKT